MKKTIILANGVKKEMTFEEVLKQFTPMINKATNIAIGKFGTSIEREDMIQEMKLEMWRAYEMYDETHAFSTLLTFKLKKVTGNEAQRITAKKRTSCGVLSMNATIGDTEDLTLENMFSEEDYAAEGMIASEMMAVIMPALNEREKEEFRCIMYPREHSVVALAEARGISRQAANQRVNKTKAKLQGLLVANHFVTA
jgi:RNA polymerase sigma factor (sigma-70 family)